MSALTNKFAAIHYSYAADNHPVTFEPACISSDRGDKRFHQGLEYIRCPNDEDTFYLYHIGKYRNIATGLSAMAMCGVTQWVRGTVVNDDGILLTVYTEEGRIIANTDVWLTHTPKGAFVVAVKKTGVVKDHVLSVRFYTPMIGKQTHSSYVFSSESDLSRIDPQHWGSDKRWERRTLIDGYTVQGLGIDQIPFNVPVTFEIDTTVVKEQTFPLGPLKSFESELDSCRKYLLISSERTPVYNHMDDVDVWVEAPSKDGNLWYGVYLGRNNTDTLRQLTGYDFTVKVSTITALVAVLRGHPDTENFTGTYRIRLRYHTGISKSSMLPVKEKLHEAYKLSLYDYRSVLLGIDSLNPYWRCEKLENIQGAALLNKPIHRVTDRDVIDYTGYDGLVKWFGSAVRAVETITVEVPEAYQTGSTALVFTPDGLFNRVEDMGAVSRLSIPEGEGYVHFLTGVISDESLVIGDVIAVSSPNVAVFVNRNIYIGNHWERLDTAEYQYTDGTITAEWLDNISTLAVRELDNIRVYQTDLTLTEGFPRLTLTENGSPLAIRFDAHTIFLNGHYLVMGLDVHLQHSDLVVTAKRYWRAGQNTLTVICRMESVSKPDESGFIIHNRLSDNGSYALHEDQNPVLYVGGRMMLPTDVAYSELDDDASSYSVLNGLPYTLHYPYVNLSAYGVLPEDRQLSLAIGAAVSRTLTHFIEDTVIPDINVIADRHTVFSPLLNAIITDMTTGELTAAHCEEAMRKDKMDFLLQRYSVAMASDPFIGTKADTRFVVIHASLIDNLALPPSCIMFLREVAKHYFVNPIFVNLNATGDN